MELPDELLEQDLIEALKDMQVYVDITPADLKKIYAFATEHAKRRLLGVKAGDIMSTPAISTTPDESLEQVAELLEKHHISGIPVVEKEKVVGVISEADIVRALTGMPKTNLFKLAIGKKELRRARDVMSTPAITVTPDMLLYEIAELFTHKNINRVPVVDENEHLLGIITRADLIRSQAAGVKL